MGAEQTNINMKYNNVYGYYEVNSLGVVKQYELTSKQQQQSFQNLLKRYNNFKVPTILPILQSEPFADVRNGKYEWKLIFKNLQHTLQNQIQQMKQKGTKYSEQNILKLIDCALSALMAFRLKELSHGNISCQSILIDTTPQIGNFNQNSHPNSNIYVLGLPLLLNPTFQSKIIHGHNYKSLYLSPLGLIQISQGRQKLTICEKGQVFSLGIVILKMASQCNHEQFYNYENFHIVQQSLRKRIRQCEGYYSKQLCSMISKMVAIQQHIRPDFQQLFKIFSNITIKDEETIIQKSSPANNFQYSLSSSKNLQKFSSNSPSKIQETLTKPKIIHLNNSNKKKIIESQKKPEIVFEQLKKTVISRQVSSMELIQGFKVSKNSKKAWIKLQNRRNGPIITSL